MKYTIVFFLLGIYLIILGFKFSNAGWLLLWFGANFVVVGAAYGWLGAKAFGKRSDGKIAGWALCLLLPYLLLNWTLWHIQRLITKSECCNKIAPNIWIGRRAVAKELPDNISLIVDLTAELTEPPDRKGRGKGKGKGGRKKTPPKRERERKIPPSAPFPF